MAESTDIITKMLEYAGVRDVVVSSGSRSLRMVRAVADNAALDVRMIIDERVAAFFALGISECTSRPVALICTSGSAMLNYAPAIAEAYYRGIPLIAVTADRPKCMIDINDGQTIHQYGSLGNIVKYSADIDATKPCSDADFDEIARCMSIATSPRKGPVHINLRLEEGSETDTYQEFSYVVPDILSRSIAPDATIYSVPFENLTDKKILLFLGQMEPDGRVDKILEILSKRSNIVIISDIVSNCRASGVITDIESIIGEVSKSPATYNPDIFISLGKTSPVSRRFKEWLRAIDGYSHWRVNDTDRMEDTYFHLEKIIVSDDRTFLERLLRNNPDSGNMTYRLAWNKLQEKSVTIKERLVEDAPWSDIFVIGKIMKSLPEDYAIQCSNGLSIRYLALIGAGKRLLYCNRGVNGIDGSTSTAIGYSSASQHPTLLITGDMSAAYDISALFSGQITPKFKMIVIANKGGEIFRHIKATCNYGNREEMLCKIPAIEWKYVARSVGFDFHEANDAEQLSIALKSFFNNTGHPGLMVVNTPAGNSEIYGNIINEINNNL